MSFSSEPLNCESFEDRIHQILDDRLTLTGDPLLVEHAAHCQPCENMLHEYDAVDDSIKILKEDMDLILGSIDTPNRKRSLAQRPMALIATLAAALLVCFSTFHMFNDGAENARPTRPNVIAKVVPKKKKASVTIGNSLAAANIKPTYRPTPDTSPFSPNFSVARNIPRIPSASNWNEVTSKIEPVLNYSSELPGVRATHCSIKVTIELFLKSFEKPNREQQPDLGWKLELDNTSLV